ncbi:MAG: hypothetical protein J6W84_08250 [Bacteroidales bacterium]|nr:hypothetical protein [Bacteroidales bacterium]
MNSFEHNGNFIEEISQVIEVLELIKKNNGIKSDIDRDIVLELIRKAYVNILKCNNTGTAEEQAKLLKEEEERNRREQEERERLEREEKARQEQLERERIAREEEERKRREQEERERLAREEKARQEQLERERIAREEEERKRKEQEAAKTEAPQTSPELFDIFTPISEAGKSVNPENGTGKQFVKTEKKSLNDLLQEQNPEKPSLYSKIQESKIEDLAKAISLNDKFLFIKELFKNQGEDFSKAIKLLNQCSNLEEAFAELEKMKKFYLWDTVSPAYLTFCDLVRRRFL